MKKVDARSSGAEKKRADKGQKSTEKKLSVKKESGAKLSLPEKTEKASKELVPAKKSNEVDYSLLGVTSKKRQQAKAKQAKQKEADEKYKQRTGKTRTPLAIMIITPVVCIAIVVTIYFGYLIKSGYFRETIVASMADGSTANVFLEDALSYISTDKFFEGTKIDGIDVGGMTKEQAKEAVVAAQPKSPEKVAISLSLDGKEYDLDFST